MRKVAAVVVHTVLTLGDEVIIFKHTVREIVEDCGRKLHDVLDFAFTNTQFGFLSHHLRVRDDAPAHLLVSGNFFGKCFLSFERLVVFIERSAVERQPVDLSGIASANDVFGVIKLSLELEKCFFHSIQ